MARSESWRYEKLTWPEINEAVKQERVVICPVGSTEQHGPHLPLDVDVVCPRGVAEAAARLIRTRCWSCTPSCTGTRRT